MKTRLVTFVIIILFLISSKYSRGIDSGLNMVVSPLPINLISTPGATVSAQLKIKNGGIEPETLEVGLMKFSAYGENGQPRLIDRETGDDYFDWITFSEKEFTLKPNEWKTITAYITIPNEAAYGYYYAVTFGRKSEYVGEGARTTKVIGATASLILLEVRVPSAIRDVEVLDFSTPRKVYEFLPTNFAIKLKNKGNVHVAPGGNIFIDRYNHKDVAILNVNEFKGNVLPGSNRVFESVWQDGFPVYTQQIVDKQVVSDKTGKPEMKLAWDWTQLTKFRWGKYTANLLLVYDNGERDIPIEAVLDFWVIPWRILLGLAVVVGLIMLGVYSIFKKPITNLIKRFKKQK